jgi:hypothetical protein
MKLKTTCHFFGIIAIMMMMSCTGDIYQTEKNNYIQPYDNNPFYWQYNNKPIVFLGGTWQDNLFNHPTGLEQHLQLLQSVGGNYVRNVMSHRNVGNEFAYARSEDGLFDLNRFNDEYWQRFKNFLDICYQRDIIVQLEIWDPWDHYEDHQSFGGWSHHPFNPINNINYSPDESRLPTEITYAPQTQPTDHAFFRTVPSLENNELVLQYQTAFFDQILSFTLQYPNVLYCINNESGEQIEWSDYWADHIRKKAANSRVAVHITEMRRNENVRAEDHHHVFDNPKRYTFLDISQNNAWSGLGEGHYNNILFVRDYIADHPRPINNIKNYGAARHGEEESVARFCRIVFAGCASARFHRPHPLEDPASHEAATEFGLGLSPRAQAVIKAMRIVVDELDITATVPYNDLLSEREENEAYLIAEVGKQYAIYFPKDAGDGMVVLDLTNAMGSWRVKWVNVSTGTGLDQEQEVQGGEKVPIKKPDEGHWAVVILPVSGDKS